MPRSPAEQIALAAKFIRDRSGKRKVRERGDTHWMIQLATWLEFEAECLAEPTDDDPAAEFALAIARAYLGEDTDA